MKKQLILAASVAIFTATAGAQSAVDALQLTQRDFKGTARFMSMGGAFTALGGDLSAIGVNPGGIGVYRSSEIAATLDIDIQGSKTESQGYSETNKQTKVYCNNFGYVGTAVFSPSSALQTFSWGVTYNRLVSFDRLVSGYAMPVNTSLTNYIAAFTNGTSSGDLGFGDNYNYNPYSDSNCDWLSILGYNSYLINNINGSSNSYLGLFQNGITLSDAMIKVHEKGYVDNYQFTFGGNFVNTVYWGVGVGINDLRYVRRTEYSESMSDALVYADNAAGTTPGTAEYYLDNDKLVTGTGWNISFGLIVKPIQELRIGASIISPTWYRLNESYIADVDYAMTPTNTNFSAKNGYECTDEAYFSWRLNSPWRFNAGLAAVLGSRAIVSLDYEFQAYNDINVKTPYYDNWGYITGFDDYGATNDNIRSYTQNANNLRVGVEYRITPKFSARVGYNLQMSNINSAYKDGYNEIITAGTDPSFSLDKTTNYISAGLGYKFGNFYADATYVHKTAKSTLLPYTSYSNIIAPSFDVTENNNSIVLSLGFKF